MFKAIRHIFFISILLAFCASSSAQDLPTLGQQAGITVGRFANGISYYIVPNTTSKGYANFALVQKGVDNSEDARSALDYSFLSSKGVGYTRDGYISYQGGAAVFSFEDVPTFQSVALDSTIILLFNLISSCRNEQAIVACGDFDAAKLKDRLYMMSLTVAKKEAPRAQEPYVWSPSTTPRFIQYQNNCRSLSEIRVSYASPRTPQKYMSTPQPLVSTMFSRELGYILRKRLESLFLEHGIPLAFVRFSYIDSAGTDSDEQYNVTIGVAEEDVRAATELISAALADLDANGVSPDEFADAKAAFITWAQMTAAIPVSNHSFVKRCVSNYLYGSSLASRSEIYNFFKGRKISPEQDLSMFNRFVSALLDPSRNLTVRFGTPSESLDLKDLQSRFRNSWQVPETRRTYRVRSNDTLALYYPVDKKVKLKADIPDQVTGGRLWTFSNGMKVLFRKTGDSQLRYTLMIRGGYTEVPGISEGESAFVGDMLELYDVCGMSAMDFRNMLEANGIKLDCKVSVSDMRISGTAPSDKLHLLLRSLLSIQKNRRINKETFAYYKRCESLLQEDFRLSADGICAVTDSIMCPDYYYPLTKSVSKLGDDLPDKAESYFSSQFMKCQDGILYIEGNLNPYGLQKHLCKVLGSFRTGMEFSVRPKVTYQLRSGWSTYSVEGNESSIGEGTSASISLAAIRPFTMQSWCAFRIAVENLRRELVKDLAPLGQYVEVKPELQLLPAERLSVFIYCRPCPWDGLPGDVVPADPMEVMSVLRESLERIGSTPVPASTLKGLKNALTNEMAGEMSSSDYIMEAYLRRNSEGKDMVSNYSTYISKITPDDIAEVTDALRKGSKVEYIIK